MDRCMQAPVKQAQSRLAERSAALAILEELVCAAASLCLVRDDASKFMEEVRQVTQSAGSHAKFPIEAINGRHCPALACIVHSTGAAMSAIAAWFSSLSCLQ